MRRSSRHDDEIKITKGIYTTGSHVCLERECYMMLPAVITRGPRQTQYRAIGIRKYRRPQSGSAYKSAATTARTAITAIDTVDAPLGDDVAPRVVVGPAAVVVPGSTMLFTLHTVVKLAPPMSHERSVVVDVLLRRLHAAVAHAD